MIMRTLPRVLKLDVAGNPMEWISYKESATAYAKGNVAWAAATTDFDIFGGTNAATGQRSVLSINTIIAVRGKFSQKALESANRITLDNTALFRRDMCICAYCCEEFPESRLTRDHIIPTSKGGKNNWMNVVTACGPCNLKKDNKSLDQLGWQLSYVPYTPNKAEQLILMNKGILADQMEFLLKRVPQHSRLLAA
jgi:hypothetical protein